MRRDTRAGGERTGGGGGGEEKESCAEYKFRSIWSASWLVGQYSGLSDPELHHA